MNIINFKSQPSVSFEGRYTPLQKANSILYSTLDKDVTDTAYRSGIPKLLVLKIMEQIDVNDTNKLAQILKDRFVGIFNLVLQVKDIDKLQKILSVPKSIVELLLKKHQQVLNEQKMISDYMEKFVSFEQYARSIGRSSSSISYIFSKWDVPNSLDKTRAIMEQGFKEHKKLSDIAKQAGINEETVARYRKRLGFIGKRESNKIERDPEIVAMLISGAKRNDVAKRFGLTKGTIDRIAQDNDVWNRKTKQRDLVVVEKIKSGVLYKDIAKEFEISVDTVKRIAKKYDCKKRKS
ncbi:hypothetical protein IKU74_06495 [bacterium]|nr:hypothetical protein [bacterium]